MFKYYSFIILIFIPAVSFCQSKLLFGIHFNPISNKIISPTLGTQFNAQTDINNYGLLDFDRNDNGIKAGLDFDMMIKEEFGIKFNPSYLTQGFNFIQNSFPKSPNSYGVVQTSVRYWGMELPLMAYKNVSIIEEKTSLKFMLGLSLDIKKLVGATNTYDLIDTGGYFAFETSIGSKANSMTGGSGIIGGSFFQRMKGNGAVELGVSYHYSLNEMPIYNYNFMLNDYQYTSELHPRIHYVSYDIIYYFGRSR